jgi:hypothetical protein
MDESGEDGWACAYACACACGWDAVMIDDVRRGWVDGCMHILLVGLPLLQG